MEHYQEMLDLYQTDYDEYARRIKDKYNPPLLPSKPQPPRPPEVGQKLAETTLDFRKQQHKYFKMTKQLNLVSLFSALLLVGGLLFLLMFDKGKKRILYLSVLALSFFFMIGPSFHSILSAIVGFLQAPQPILMGSGCSSRTGSQWIATGISQCPRDDRMGREVSDNGIGTGGQAIPTSASQEPNNSRGRPITLEWEPVNLSMIRSGRV